ncbi:hypothetical protein KI387_042270, partial [Taxus chinensis]
FDALLARFDWLRVAHSSVSRNDVAWKSAEEDAKACVRKNEARDEGRRKAHAVRAEEMRQIDEQRTYGQGATITR